jgi:hypothetical protein
MSLMRSPADGAAKSKSDRPPARIDHVVTRDRWCDTAGMAIRPHCVVCGIDSDASGSVEFADCDPGWSQPLGPGGSPILGWSNELGSLHRLASGCSATGIFVMPAV